MLRAPTYPDEAARLAGEALLQAWRDRGTDPESWSVARATARVGPTLHPGELVGDRYQLLAPAGDGALAATWAALDCVDDCVVSLKVLHGQRASDPRAVAAFEEAGGLQVSGEHLPRVASPPAVWEGFHWFALEGAPGRTLHRAVLDGMGPASALQAVVEAGQALMALHEEGHFHGLVSPDGIRLREDGSAVLHDVGLVTPTAAMGVAWLAPERLDPSVEAGPTADVYGLAMCVVFALNGGELPFWAWRAPERLVEALEPPKPVLEALLQSVSWDPDNRTLTVADLVSVILESRALRRSLAAACVEQGRPAAALAHLDALAEGDPDDPELALDRARAMESLEPESALEAWTAALEASRTRAQGATALAALIARTEGADFVPHGRALLPLLEPENRPPLQHRLGRVLLEELEDAEEALPFLEAALEGGLEAPGLADTVERLRVDRGDWPDVLRHLERRATAEAEPAHLRKALSIARFATRGSQRALRRALLELDEDAAALRVELSDERERSEAETWALMERLAATGQETPGDVVRRARAWLAAGRKEEAEAAVRTASEAHPEHLGLLAMQARFEREEGSLESALARWERLGAALEGLDLPGVDRQHEHARAELRWLLGDPQGAAELAHRRLDVDADDRQAWWLLARVAWTAPDSAPWLGATPAVVTPEEALARLLAGLLDPEAAHRWLTRTPREAAAIGLMGAPRGRLLGALVVDALLAQEQVGPALFAGLGDGFPEAALEIEAIRWLWCEPASEPLFAIPDCYRWAGLDEPFDARVSRRVLHLPIPRVGPTEIDASWAELFARGDDPLSIEEAWSAGTPQMAIERPLRTVLVAAGREPIILRSQTVTVGGDESDDLIVEGLAAARVALEKVGDHWYVLADPRVRVNGSVVSEWRVRGGERVAFDGQTLRVHRLEPGAPIPVENDDVMLDLPEGWPGKAPHAILIHRAGKREEVLPFQGDVLALGSDPVHPLVEADAEFLYKLVRTDSGYTLEDRTGAGMSELPAVLPLQHGDTFGIGDRSFTFEVQGEPEEAVTLPGPFDAKDLLPLLITEDGDGNEVLLPVLDDVFSIGRGGGNDLQLGDDAEVSRHHCMLVRGTDGACILRDSGSANGTFVNGRSVERHILQVGDRIQVGGAKLEFRLGRREDLEANLSDLLLEELEDTAGSRADTAAFRRPVPKR